MLSIWIQPMVSLLWTTNRQPSVVRSSIWKKSSHVLISSSTDVIRFQDCFYYFRILQVYLHRIHRPLFCYQVRRIYYFFCLMQSIFVLFFYNLCYWLYFLLSLSLDIKIYLLSSKINIYNSLFIRNISLSTNRLSIDFS